MDNNGAISEPDDGPNLFKPETVIAPHTATGTTPAAVPPPDISHSPQVTTPVEPAVNEAQPNAISPPEPSLPEQATQVQETEPGTITWTASEFVAHQKTPKWYLLLGLAAIILAALTWLVSRDIVAASTVILGIVLLGIYAGRKPRQETYSLDDYGLTVGRRRYDFNEFRSFALIPEGAFSSIELTPLKRFAMYTTIYFDPADEDKILEMLVTHLPMEDAHSSFADSLMRRIHF